MEHLFQRLRQIAARLNRQDLAGFDVKEVRGAIDQERARKEAELHELADLESELDGIETAIADSDTDGPTDNDSESDGEKE